MLGIQPCGLPATPSLFSLAVDRSKSKFINRETEGTQLDLAEICGMASVHVNRVVRQLRGQDLCFIRDGNVSILDYAALVRFSDFNPDYLYLKPEILGRLNEGPNTLEKV